MSTHRTTLAGGITLAASLLMGACAYANPDEPAMMPATDDGSTQTAAVATDTPGEGVDVTMGRASWSTGYFQNEVVRQLLGELGFQVSDPAEQELPVGELIDGIASGDIDVTPNGWFPSHLPELERVGPTGAPNLTAATPIGYEIRSGALQGVLADKATIDANGITSLGDIANDPELVALFDRDGNGKADLVGCDEGWGCHTIINDTINENGWSNTMEQIVGTYDDQLAEVVQNAKAGEPVLYYTWTPNASGALLVPGEDVMWLDVEPLPAQVGAADVPQDHCTAVPCDMGFPPNDIRIIANNSFLAENPSARVLFEQIALPLGDISAQNLLMTQGEDSPEDVARHASEWIETNSGLVDAWLDAARSA